jgi:leucyl aminopeptidase
MDFNTQVAGFGGLAAVQADALLVVLRSKLVPAELDAPLARVLDAAVQDGDFTFKAAQTLYLHGLAGVQAARVVFACAGDGSVIALRKALTAGVGLLKDGGTRQLAVAVAGDLALGAAHGAALVAAVSDALYVYRETKPSATPESRLRGVTVVCREADEPDVAGGLERGAAVAAGTTLARELANLPASHCTPAFLAEQARRLGKEHRIKVRVLDQKDCEKLGMGAFLAVARGSEQAPKFIVARWQGGPKSEAPVVLIGKGITFDSGGISLKPAAEMDEMKFDMGGAASVLGTLLAVARLKAKVNLIGLIPTCENMPSGRAIKPGDVVTSLSGQTIEILNTDAEGRLILCDALSYAERLDAAAVVDVATLTGACVIALGHHRSGLFSADDALAAELLDAGEQALDPAWRLPLDDEYDEALKSHFADIANVGPRAGGAITAAMFLKRFAAKLRWAHLDIAGTAWKSGLAKGATGRPVPLLTHFVLARAK